MIGLPGQGMHFGLDPLSILFLCLLAPQCVAAMLCGAARVWLFWLLLCGMVVGLTGQDAFTLIFGFALVQFALWLLEPRPSAGIALLPTACLVPAAFLPPGGIAFLLVVLAIAVPAGLLSPRVPLARLPAMTPAMSGVINGGVTAVSFYILIRYAFMVLGAAAAPWWGVVLIIIGALSVTTATLRTGLKIELREVFSTAIYSGYIAIALGIALLASCWGDPLLETLAMQAALCLIAVNALLTPLWLLAAGTIRNATGTDSLDWLGGLIRGMPKLGLLVLLGVAGVSFLPPGPGFAAGLLLLHAVMAAAAGGDAVTRIAFTALLAMLGLSAALGIGNAARIIGTGLLGRPRSLRAAAAEEAPRNILMALGLLGFCGMLLGLFPRFALLAIRPVMTRLIPHAILPPFDYAPVTLCLLMAIPAGVVFLLFRRFGVRGSREVRAWNGGLGKPPAWLPFGDPLTQPSATGFAEPLRRMLPDIEFVHAAALPWRRWTRRMIRVAVAAQRSSLDRRLAVLFVVLVLCLLLLGLELQG